MIYAIIRIKQWVQSKQHVDRRIGQSIGRQSSRWYMLSSQQQPYSQLNSRIAIRCSLRYIFLHSYTVASYTKIFRAVGHHQAQIQDHAQQQPNQPNVLNMVRYIKALHSAVWVQLALIVCYVPCFTLIILCEVRCPNDIRIEGMAIVLVFFNSILNPFLYCWKITEVRQAVKQTIREAISCA